MLYLVTVALHVVVAVLAIGLVGAIPLVARLARRSSPTWTGTDRLLGVLLRATQFGFLAMLLTGVLLDFSAGGAFHHAGWFRASVLLLVFTGLFHARARAALRRGNALHLVERWGWTMCGSIALITLLMQTKPFP
jgi:hypothetical protein